VSEAHSGLVVLRRPSSSVSQDLFPPFLSPYNAPVRLRSAEDDRGGGVGGRGEGENGNAGREGERDDEGEIEGVVRVSRGELENGRQGEGGVLEGEADANPNRYPGSVNAEVQLRLPEPGAGGDAAVGEREVEGESDSEEEEEEDVKEDEREQKIEEEVEGSGSIDSSRPSMGMSSSASQAVEMSSIVSRPRVWFRVRVAWMVFWARFGWIENQLFLVFETQSKCQSTLSQPDEKIPPFVLLQNKTEKNYRNRCDQINSNSPSSD